MRSKIAKRILDETPEDLRIFVRKHSDIVVQVQKLVAAKYENSAKIRAGKLSEVGNQAAP